MNHALHFLLLFCLHRFRGERSLAAVGHLLAGKKSAQTLQDSKWFGLERVFGVCKGVSLSELEQAARELSERRSIVSCGARSYVLTEEGKKELERLLPSARFLRHLNGFVYYAADTLFWYRLSVVSQTLSNMVHRCRFEPIQRHEATLRWVKRFLLARRQPARELARALYTELHALCSSLSEEEATMVTLRLTSFERVGWTNEQLAALYNADPLYVQLTFQGALHYMMRRATHEAPSFPLLHELVKDLVAPVALTNSARKTHEWLQKGKTVEEVARIRRLKRSTIEDHVVEIAANVPDFSIAPFVDAHTERKVREAAQQLGTRQLKKIREAVGEHVSYFEIRLVLAKEGENGAS